MFFKIHLCQRFLVLTCQLNMFQLLYCSSSKQCGQENSVLAFLCTVCAQPTSMSALSAIDRTNAFLNAYYAINNPHRSIILNPLSARAALSHELNDPIAEINAMSGLRLEVVSSSSGTKSDASAARDNVRKRYQAHIWVDRNRNSDGSLICSNLVEWFRSLPETKADEISCSCSSCTSARARARGEPRSSPATSYSSATSDAEAAPASSVEATGKGSFPPPLKRPRRCRGARQPRV